MNGNDSQLVFHDHAAVLWVFGALCTGAGVVIPIKFHNGSADVLITVIFLTVGLAVLLSSSVLTVTADRATRTLTLDYRWLLWHSTRQIPFEQVAGIHVARNADRRRGGMYYTYRVMITQKDGQVIPFRPYSSSGSAGKQQQASQLRAFIGVEAGQGNEK